MGDAQMDRLRPAVLSLAQTLHSLALERLRLQDFAFEADESRMRNGAHLMAGSLSGSLALVTGREPLRHSLGNQLRGMLAHSLDGPTLDTTIVVGHPLGCCMGGC